MADCGAVEVSGCGFGMVKSASEEAVDEANVIALWPVPRSLRYALEAADLG